MNLAHEHPRESNSWEMMIQRCTNPKATCYDNYGGRGVQVCTRWRVFRNFLADMGLRPPGTSLDRIDNERGYAPGNCRWATRVEQQQNRRDSQRGKVCVCGKPARHKAMCHTCYCREWRGQRAGL